MLERLFNGLSLKTSIDETGRIVLPQKLRTKIDIGEEAYFIASGDTFQIWKPETYDGSWNSPRPKPGSRACPRTSIRSPFSTRRRGTERWQRRRAPHRPTARTSPSFSARSCGRRAGEGRWLDGTFGAGGYARGLLDAGAARVIGVDRDPRRFDWPRTGRTTTATGCGWSRARSARSTHYADGPLDGVVLDLGVSSMQLDQAERGFSFLSRRAARHADEPGRAFGRRPRQHRLGGAIWPTSCTSTARSARRAGSRGRSSKARAEAPFTTHAASSRGSSRAACRARSPASPMPRRAASRRCASR